jgi:hypothetical protein
MTDSRKVFISVVASVVVIGLVVGLVLAFAIIPLPDFPLLADDPDPAIPGTVAFARWENDGLCISTVPAGGGDEREIICEQNIGFGEFTAGWTPDGLLIVEEFRPNGEWFRLVDPDTAETVERVGFQQTSLGREPIPIRKFEENADGLTLLVEGPRGEPRLEVYGNGSVERTILSVDGPADYWFNSASWSPDGEWILLQDSEGRVLIVSPDGDPNARILTDDVDSWMAASWYIPGYEEGTWDPREA